MARRHRPAKRLLVPPALLLAAVVALVHAVGAAGPVAPPADPVVAELPALAGDETRTCPRGADPALAEAVAAALDLRGRVTSTMVLGCPTAFDGQRVRYVGEVVGDLLHRDGGAWTLVNDDDYALDVGPLPAHREHRGTNQGLAVWLPDALLDELTAPGRPGRRGDVVEVRGTLLRTDPDDGGGLTVRAAELDVLRPAVELDEPLDLPRLWLAVGALLATGVLWALRRRDANR